MNMKAKPTDEPLRQLLEHGAQGGIDRTFVNQLLDDCRDHASEYPRKVAHLATATDAELDAAWRKPYLDEFLRYAARDLPWVLFFKWTDRAASDAERKRAALLYLHGGGLGYWKISPSNLTAAREAAGIEAKNERESDNGQNREEAED